MNRTTHAVVGNIDPGLIGDPPFDTPRTWERALRTHRARPHAATPRAVPRPPVVDTLVTDIDHTLLDCASGWGRSLRAMLGVLPLSSASEAELLTSLREVYRRARTLDAPAALEEAASRLTGPPSAMVLRYAAHAYRAEARVAFAARPGVARALAAIKFAGAMVIGYTDSPPAATLARLMATGLAPLIDVVVSTTHDAALPSDLRLALAVPIDTRGGPPVLFAEAGAGAGPSLGVMLLDHLSPGNRPLVVGADLERDVNAARRTGQLAAWARYAQDPKDDQTLTRLYPFSAAPRTSNVPSAGVLSLRRFDDLVTYFKWTRARRESRSTSSRARESAR